MSDTVRHPLPATRAVLAERLRFVGLALRREAAVGAALLAALLVLPWREEPLRISREIGPAFAVLGLVWAFALWRGRPGGDQLWAMPVDHRRHALAQVAAGWCWLVGAAGALLLWFAALVLLSGGELSPAGTRELLGPAGLTRVAWRTPGWFWLVPLAACTVAYLLASALVLATARPWRWLGGLALAAALVLLLGDEATLARARGAVAAVGLETALLGSAVSRERADVLLATGETVRAWRALPTAGGWAAATLLWLAIGAAALWAATLRLRERGDGDDAARR